MTTSVSQTFKIIAFIIITLFGPLYVKVDILLTCAEHLHGCIISLRDDAWTRKTSGTQPFCNEVSVPR